MCVHHVAHVAMQEYTLQRLHVKLNDMMLYVYCGAAAGGTAGPQGGGTDRPSGAFVLDLRPSPRLSSLQTIWPRPQNLALRGSS